MEGRLLDLIQEARVEVRRVSRVTLTSAERAEQNRAAQMRAMDDFAYETFRPHLLLPLKSEVVWTGSEAATQFKVDGRVFQLRKAGDGYRLVLIGEPNDCELLRLDKSDAQFANRVLVAIGDCVR